MKTTAILAGLAASGIAILSSKGHAQNRAGEEVVLGAEANSRYLEFQVRSGGCTRKAHFGVETISQKPLTVRLLRLRPDYCEAYLPEGEKIRFTYAEIGAPVPPTTEDLQRIVIVNERTKP